MDIKDSWVSLPLWYRFFWERVVAFRDGRGKKNRSLRYLCGLVDGWVLVGVVDVKEGERLHAVIENAKQYRGK